VPKGVHVQIPLQAYFRINTENMGQFERTLIIADEGSFVHYVEGCTAPIYKTDSLHAAVVEIIVKKHARVRYTTIQNWSTMCTTCHQAFDGRRGRHHGVDRRQHRVQGLHEVPGGLADGSPRQGRDLVDRIRR
jgi:Fe-S cluster assembly scaffold protein SufB